MKCRDTICPILENIFTLNQFKYKNVFNKSKQALLFKQSLTTNAYALPMPSEAPVTTKTERGTGTGVIHGSLIKLKCSFHSKHWGRFESKLRYVISLPLLSEKSQDCLCLFLFTLNPTYPVLTDCTDTACSPVLIKNLLRNKTRTACFQWFPTLPIPPDPD